TTSGARAEYSTHRRSGSAGQDRKRPSRTAAPRIPGRGVGRRAGCAKGANMAVTGLTQRAAPKSTSPLDLLYRPEVRQGLFQLILVAALVALFLMIISNTSAHLQRPKIASGFGFWNTTSGFDISQTLIPYSNIATYGRAFWVGLTNTLVVAAIGIVLATVVGFTMGVARLSSNWLVARLATVYVECIRNIPLL